MARSLSESAREKMLAAAQEIISEVGVHAVTVDEVARRSGVAKTTIYRHFESGSELIVCALDQMIEPFPTADTGSLRGDLEALTTAVLPHVNSPEARRMMADMFALSARESGFGRVHQALIDERKAPVRTALQRAISRGELAAETDLDMAIDLFEGFFIYRRVLLDQPITNATASAFICMFLRAHAVAD